MPTQTTQNSRQKDGKRHPWATECGEGCLQTATFLCRGYLFLLLYTDTIFLSIWQTGTDQLPAQFEFLTKTAYGTDLLLSRANHAIVLGYFNDKRLQIQFHQHSMEVHWTQIQLYLESFSHGITPADVGTAVAILSQNLTERKVLVRFLKINYTGVV